MYIKIINNSNTKQLEESRKVNTITNSLFEFFFYPKLNQQINSVCIISNTITDLILDVSYLL